MSCALLRLNQLRAGCGKFGFRARCVRARPQLSVNLCADGLGKRLRAIHARPVPPEQSPGPQPV